MAAKIKAPFPAFGGKSRAADLVWQRLGAVRNFVEPFCFSAAMLLLRPDEPQIETINDMNAYVANFWRAVNRDPEAVAYHADWPVNETDLHARHAWLVRSDQSSERLQAVRDDPEAFDAKIAGWWCWGACIWIGSGWCDDQQSPHMSGGQGVLSQKIPHMDQAGRLILSPSRESLSQAKPELRGDSGAIGTGIHASGALKRLQLCNGSTTYGQGVHKRPILTSDGGTGGKGIHSQLSQQVPHIADGGMFIHGKERPQLADAYSRGRGVHGNDALSDCDRRTLWLLDWFGRLCDRLRAVRVCCGHWDRVCDSDSTLTRLGTTGVFLDPPYRKKLKCGKKNRAAHIYANDKTQDVDKLCDEVQAWCLKWGDDKQIRIAVCGLEGEYPELDAAEWDKVAWKSQGGYGNRNGDNENAKRERIWFSPHCLKPGTGQQELFT